MIKAPCKNCIDREFNCHSKCDKYIKYHESRLELSTTKIKAKEIDEYFICDKLKAINHNIVLKRKKK